MSPGRSELALCYRLRLPLRVAWVLMTAVTLSLFILEGWQPPLRLALPISLGDFLLWLWVIRLEMKVISGEERSTRLSKSEYRP